MSECGTLQNVHSLEWSCFDHTGTIFLNDCRDFGDWETPASCLLPPVHGLVGSISVGPESMLGTVSHMGYLYRKIFNQGYQLTLGDKRQVSFLGLFQSVFLPSQPLPARKSEGWIPPLDLDSGGILKHTQPATRGPLSHTILITTGPF